MFRPLLLVTAVLAALAAPARGAAPAPPTVAISGLQVIEGNAGLTAFEASVSLSPYGPQGTYEVEITASPGAATEADYVFTPVRLLLQSGAPPQIVKGSVIGDETFEGDEAFDLHAAGTSGFVLSQDGRVTIVDDDTTGIPFVTIDPMTAVQEGTGWHWIDVAVRLSAPATHVITFTYETTGGQPASEDPEGGQVYGEYRQTKGMKSILPGETVANIQVEIHGDTMWEPDTSFQIWLSEPHGALFDVARGTVVMVNDDAPTFVQADDVTVVEGNAGTSQALVRFRFDPPAPEGAKLLVKIEGGSALEGEDFVSRRSDTLYPARGATELVMPIEIRGDTWAECTEGVSITYQPYGLGNDSPRHVTLTILDDDGGPIVGAPGSPCPHPFVHTETGSPVGRPVAPVDGGAAVPDGGAPVDASGVDAGNGLTKRGGCGCASAPRAPSTGALLLLGLATVTARRRRRANATPAR